MSPPKKAESQYNSSPSPNGSNKGATVNIQEDLTSDPEKGPSGNNGKEDTEANHNFFSLLSDAKGQFVFWWFWPTVVLAILLALSATRFRTVHIRQVRLFGLFCWLAISWAGLLASYLFAWVLSYFWYTLCNIFVDDGENYNTFFVDIRHSMMLLAWGFICWSTVPLLCRVDHHHCTIGWVPTFHKVMLAALVVDIVYFVKDLLLELLFLRAAIEFIHPRKKTFKNIVSTLELLTLVESKPPKNFSAGTILQKILKFFSFGWVWEIKEDILLIRRWSNPEEQRKIEPEEDQQVDEDFEELLFEDPEAVTKAWLALGVGDGNKKVYSIVAQYIKSLVTKCDLEGPPTQIPPIEAKTPRGWSKILHSFKGFFKHPPDDFCQSLPRCIHEQVRSCQCRIDSHLDTSAQDRSCQDGGVSHAKTNTTDELQEATSVSEVPSRDGSCNDQCQASCQTIARGVWCKRQVALHIRKVLSGSQRQSASKRIALFKSFDKLWDVLDRNGDGFVSFQELHWLVEDVGESLKEVISGQKNLMVVVRDLNFVLSIALLAPVALIYVLFFVKNPSSYLAPVWATFAGLSFALQGPVKSFTDACIFVFSQHPYDVGDWVIWGKEKDLKLVVEEIRLLYTTFTCADSGKTVHIPHTELCTGYIENLSRTSTYFVKSIVLHVEAKVDKCHKEAIDKFQQEKLREFLRSGEKRDICRYHQLPKISVVPIKAEDLDEKGIRVEFQRKEWTPGRFFRHEKKCRHEVMTFIRQHLPDLIKSDSKIDSGEQQTSGTIQPRMLASSDEGREFEEEGGLSVKPSPPVS